jgi:hypothetical protein
MDLWGGVAGKKNKGRVDDEMRYIHDHNDIFMRWYRCLNPALGQLTVDEVD